MRAGLATLDVLEDERLGDRAPEWALVSASACLATLRVRDGSRVRGAGMLSGIEFRLRRHLTLRMAFEAFRHIHAGMFGQVR